MAPTPVEEEEETEVAAPPTEAKKVAREVQELQEDWKAFTTYTDLKEGAADFQISFKKLDEDAGKEKDAGKDTGKDAGKEKKKDQVSIEATITTSTIISYYLLLLLLLLIFIYIFLYDT